MIRASLLLFALVASVAPAAADPEKARKLAEEGNAAVGAGDFKTAATKYTEAYREDTTKIDVFCNIGISYFKIGELPRAHLLLQQCIARSSLGMTFKDTAKAVVDSIEQTLREGKHTPVTIKVNPDNTSVVVVEFGEESKFVGDRTLWLPFGPHQVIARVEGFEPQTISILAADQNPKEVPITLERIPPKVQVPRQRAPSPSKLPPLLVTGGMAIALGVAILTSGRAKDEAEAASFASDLPGDPNDPDAPNPFDEFRADAQSEVDKWNRFTGIALGVAAAAGVVSGYLWYRALKTPPYLEVTPTAGGATATFTHRF